VPREKSGGHRERTNSKAAEETKSKSLLASNSYLLFSYLIPWNTTELLDRICTKDLLLHPPSPHVTFGLKRYTKLPPVHHFFRAEREFDLCDVVV
jgi:hypothetical protein